MTATQSRLPPRLLKDGWWLECKHDEPGLNAVRTSGGAADCKKAVPPVANLLLLPLLGLMFISCLSGHLAASAAEKLYQKAR